MGVGSTIANIDGSITYATTDSLIKRNILGEAFAKEEYLKYCLDYRYVKVLGITVSVMPLVNNSNIKRYFKFDWMEPEASYGTLDIARDDNAKVVYGNITKNIILKYKPPNANMTGSAGIAYNLRNWIMTVNTIDSPTNYNGYLTVYNNNSTTTVNWNIKLAFKGAVITQITSKISKLIERISLEDMTKIKNKIIEQEAKIGKIEEEKKEEEEEAKEEIKEGKKEEEIEEDEEEVKEEYKELANVFNKVYDKMGVNLSKRTKSKMDKAWNKVMKEEEK